MIRKVLLCASSILFLQVIFLFVFKVDLRAFTRCYVDGTLIGDMHTWDTYYGYPFLVKGRSGTVEFYDKNGKVFNNEVKFRPGGGAWTPYSLFQKSQNRYFLDFPVPDNNDCGPWWTNTDFHYIVDGKHHYCDDFTVKYALGASGDFLNPTCLATSTPVGGGGCQMVGVTGNTRQAGLHEGYYIMITKSAGESCGSYRFWIQNGISTNCGNLTDYGDTDCMIAAGRFSWAVSGGLRGYLTYPATYHFTVKYAESFVQLYEFINNLYCGGCLDCGPITTPTPAIPVGCTTVMAHTDTSGGSGQSLLNAYNNTQSTLFTSSRTGNVDKAEIYAYTDRDISEGGKLLYCKLVQGNCNTSSTESTPYDGPYSANVSTWMRMYFPVLIPIVSGQQYRLCCRVNHLWGGGALYWRNGPVGDLTDRPRKLYVCLTTPTPTPTATSTPTPTPTATPIPSAVAWFQTREGDVLAGSEIRSLIPSTATDRNFSTKNVGGYPGIVSYGTSASMGSGFPSDNTVGHWLIQTAGIRKYYDYFYSLLDSPTLESAPTGGDVTQADLLADLDGIKAYSGNISTPSSGWDLGTKKVVVIINGKFLAKGKIAIDTSGGGSLVIIAKDHIGLDKNIIADGSSTKFQGVFITDETFYSSIEPDFTFTPASSNKKLVVDGIGIARSFDLRRDLGGGAGGNVTIPAETFRYDPSLMMNTHQDIWVPNHSWAELTP